MLSDYAKHWNTIATTDYAKLEERRSPAQAASGDGGAAAAKRANEAGRLLF